MSLIHSTYHDNIGQRLYSNISTWSKIGYCGSVNNVERDVAPWMTIPYVWITTSSTVYITSMSTADSSNGAGAREVKVYYLKEDFTEATATVSLAGTATALVATDVYRVNNAMVSVSGTSLAAAGNIIIHTASGTTAGFISSTKTRQRQMIYTVPLGKTLYVNDIAFASGKQTTAHYIRFTTRANYDDKADVLLQRGLFMPFNEVILSNTAYNRELYPPTRLPATVDIKVSAVSDATDTADVACTLRGYLITG